YKGMNYILSTMHNAIRWSKTDPFIEWKGSNVGWIIVGRKVNRQPAATKGTGQGTHGELSTLKANQTPRSLQTNSVKKPCSQPRKRKRSDNFVPLQKLKMVKLNSESMLRGSEESCLVNMPLGA
ncbi:hypothetical protein L208DRAFT_1270875, partial [Tricholoma matsutake]